MAIARVPTGFYQRLRASAATANERVVMRQFIWWGVYDDYEFPFSPRDISYEELAPEIAEVARNQRYPHVEQKSPRLMKVSFDVRIADRESGGIRPIDDQLVKLRNMALRNTGVTFHGLDKLITYRGTGSLASAPQLEQAWYRLTGFSIQSVRREVIAGFGHSISIADCSFQFVEWRNEVVDFIPVPRLIYPSEVERAAVGSGPGAVMADMGPALRTHTDVSRQLAGV